MKTKEELTALKNELEALNAKLAELSDEELRAVVGGVGDGEVLPFEACKFECPFCGKTHVFGYWMFKNGPASRSSVDYQTTCEKGRVLWVSSTEGVIFQDNSTAPFEVTAYRDPKAGWMYYT